MTPGANYAVVGGLNSGSSEAIPGAFPCGGTILPIEFLPPVLPGAPHYVVGVADGAGNGSVNAGVPAAACGLVSVVGIDLATCAITPTLAL